VKDAWTTHILAPGDERLRVPSFRVAVTRGRDKGKEATAARSDLVVGTQPACDLTLTDPTVSRSHLSIEARPDGFRLRDLGSTNGTWVSGVRIVEAFVEPGADIELGETRLRFTTQSSPLELPLYQGDAFGPMLGRSTVMRQVFALLARAAQTDATVLLLGETGTGKDLAAEALHQASPRASGPFVVVDCSAIPEALIESELFGHERGAFTGATDKRIGAFEAADRGTVFLDEIGELPLELQPKLLRVLERKTVKPVGANATREIDVRVVAATNRDLRAEVNRGAFREDLFFRLSVITAQLPPLRERGEDVAALAERFWREAGAAGALPSELRQRLAAHRWDGNVRELRNAVERAHALGASYALGEAPAPGDSPPALHVDVSIPFKEAKRQLVERFERPYLSQLLAANQGNVSAAARQAGLDRVHLIKLLRQHGLK
jgi:DNA-binding NtrC family response regulator